MGRHECVTNKNKPHRTSAGRLGLTRFLTMAEVAEVEDGEDMHIPGSVSPMTCKA